MKKGRKTNDGDVGVDCVEDGDAGGLQLLLFLLVHAGLAVPHLLHLSRVWAIALPQAWLPHHHHAEDAPGAGGVLLLLLCGLPSPPPVASLLPLFPPEEGDLVLLAGGAETGVSDPLALANLWLELVVVWGNLVVDQVAGAGAHSLQLTALAWLVLGLGVGVGRDRADIV